jgi:hypothetical protein
VLLNFRLSQVKSALRLLRSKLDRENSPLGFGLPLVLPLGDICDNVARTFSRRADVVSWDDAMDVADRSSRCSGSFDATDPSTTDWRTLRASLPKLKNEKKY